MKAGGTGVEGEKGGEMTSEQTDKLITFGQMALEQGWYDQARDYFEQTLALDASNREAMKGLARVNEILSRRETAAVGPIQGKPVEPVEPVRDYVEWLEKCSFCKQGGVFRVKKPPLFGRFGTPRPVAYVCDVCAAKLIPLGPGERNFRCVSVNLEYPGMQVYRNTKLTREELIRISEGGRSDSEQERLEAEQRDKQLAQIAQGDLSLLPAMPEEEVDVILQKGERLLAKAIDFRYAETRAVRLYSGSGSSVSFRVAKGVRFRVGSGGGRSYSKQELKTLDVGTFYITTKRYIFIGRKTNVIQPLKKVASVEVLSDGIAISRTGKIKKEHFRGPGVTQESLKGFAAILEGAIRNL